MRFGVAVAARRQMTKSVISALAAAAVGSILAVTAAEAGPVEHKAARGQPFDSLSPLIERVLPGVVAVSVNLKPPPADERDGEGTRDASPADDLLNRFFGDRDKRSRSDDDDRDEDRSRVTLGSGFIIDPAGYVVTNNHVIERAASITVILDDNVRCPAQIVGRDPYTDLAVLKIAAPRPLTALQWGDSGSARVGDWVVAIGNPYGLGVSATAGIISARGRDIDSGPYDDYLQIDAPINRGNSGGPTFNMAGEVIGINTAIYSPSGGSVGIGFAIPAALARPIIEQLKRDGRVERGWLGMQLQQLTPEIAAGLGIDTRHGALVASLAGDGPAARAGIRQGDVILAYDGKRIERPRDLSLAVAASRIGAHATLRLWRDGAEATLRPVVGEMPQDEEAEDEQSAQQPVAHHPGALGLQFGPLSEEARRRLGLSPAVRGAVVVAVAPDSLAADDLEPGDVVVSIDKHPVHSPSEAATKLQRAAKGGRKAILLLINRDGTERYVGLPTG
jgi:serine protease Do